MRSGCTREHACHRERGCAGLSFATNPYLYQGVQHDPIKDFAPISSHGVEIVASSPEVFGDWIRAESQKWGRVIRERKITLE